MAKHPPINWRSSSLRRLVRDYIAPQWKLLLASLIMMMLAAASTAALAKLMEPILDKIFIEHQSDRLIQIGLMVLGVFVVRGLATFGQSVLMQKVGLKMVMQLQQTMFKKLMRADLAYFHQQSTGHLLSRFTNECYSLRQGVANGVTNIGKDALTLILLVGVMFYQDWQLAAMAFVVFPLSFIPIRKIGQRMRAISRQSNRAIADFTSMLGQSLQAIRQIKTYNLEHHESQRAEQHGQAILALSLRAGRVRSSPKAFMEILAGLAVTAIIVYGGQQVISGVMTGGEFFSFITALLLAYEPVKKLADLNTQLQESLAAADQIFATLDQQPQVVDADNPVVLNKPVARLTLAHVSFTYPEQTQLALNDLSLSIEPGQRIALVGRSGAGKSTILNLIPRLYDVSSGRILFDGHDIRNIRLDSLRQHIAMVTQETVLFNDTVANNIRMGRLNASDADIFHAAHQAAALEFIEQLPDGMNTMVGENGTKLSGGQRQRIAIARAFLKQAPLLLLDEATSALDTTSEQLVQASLDKLMQSTTCIVVAHRLSTVMNADCIYVLENGRVIESGTHSALLQKDGAYAVLVNTQLQAAPDHT